MIWWWYDDERDDDVNANDDNDDCDNSDDQKYSNYDDDDFSDDWLLDWLMMIMTMILSCLLKMMVMMKMMKDVDGGLISDTVSVFPPTITNLLKLYINFLMDSWNFSSEKQSLLRVFLAVLNSLNKNNFASRQS